MNKGAFMSSLFSFWNKNGECPTNKNLLVDRRNLESKDIFLFEANLIKFLRRSIFQYIRPGGLIKIHTKRLRSLPTHEDLAGYYTNQHPVNVSHCSGPKDGKSNY